MTQPCSFPAVLEPQLLGRYLFPQDIPTLRISSGCDALPPVQVHDWILELVLSYQALDFVNNQTQRWVFQKVQKEAIAVCYNEQDEILVSLIVPVEQDTADFDEFSLYIFDGRCMLPEEYNRKLQA
jgi:hypothetical protein